MAEKTLEDQVRASGEALAETRSAARDAAVRAIRAIESELVAALDGDTLRNLPRLAPGFRAARVRNSDAADSLPLIKDGELVGRAVLVLDRDGRLAMARRTKDLAAGWEVFPATDEQLQAEDVECVTSAVHAAMRDHLASVDRTSRRYAELEALSRRLISALEGEDTGT